MFFFGWLVGWLMLVFFCVFVVEYYLLQSWKVKYVGDEEEQRCFQLSGLNKMDKVLAVQGARIAYSIWDVGGEEFVLFNILCFLSLRFWVFSE